MIQDIDIGVVAKRSGFSASTLRYYEEIGLIRSIGRSGLRRMFDPDVLNRLALIALGRRAGFTLSEIAAMFRPDGTKIDRDQLRAKAEELDLKIKQLTAIRDGLSHAARCPAPSHLECETFQKLLTLAAKDQKRKK
ncbi:Redox-sensitive transcriptional activator SoxR [Roseovarius albus]|uniref:Redox-sensitive transcriptional activator SoxR n=1 Tax=Roseovarius albus TaxID=1247867 RepID=A0A1X6Z628_9RHOB|nr:helix-turn-helix domain-containing protein [Roseovarius albus]SLN41512.1 Redox-sensitive transcriptional activator SoxR [Roseovarius albus]